MSDETRRIPWRGIATVVALMLFGAAFVALLFHLTDGKRQAPPAELRTEPR